MSYQQDRSWADAYLPQVRAIVGPRLLVPAPIERDIAEATDLIVLRARDMTIAVRLRRNGYSSRYPRQFTLRSRRANGVKTELAKIVSGWADWLFYGHVGATMIAPWYLIDLHALRAAFVRYPSLLHRPDETASSRDIPNADGSTFFRWFSLDHLPHDVLIAEGTAPARAAA